MTKMDHERPKYPITVENNQNAPNTTLVPRKLLKWPKYNWNLLNKQKNLETSENDQNTPKLSQNAPDFL